MLRDYVGKAVFGCALLFMTMPAFAASEPDNRMRPSTETQSAKGEPLICKRFDMTGTRVKRQQFCLTAEQWKKIETNQY